MAGHRARFLVSAVSPRDYPPADRPEIAIAGRSNVGKSTLINAMLGIRKLAKVSQQPGKTRQVNFFEIDESFYFVDLPGYGFAKVAAAEQEKWGPMMETYLQTRDNLRGVVVLIDLRRGFGELDRQMLDYVQTFGRPALLVFTKADKLKGNALRNQIREVGLSTGLDPKEILVTSAVTKQGLTEVWRELNRLLK